jgi:hypothetical protein
MADGVGNKYTSCVVEKIANKKGVAICKLPPYHYQLNPSDWFGIRRHATVCNTQFKTTSTNN